MSLNRDNGAEMARQGPMGATLGPGTIRVNPQRSWLRPLTSPDQIGGAPRVHGAFTPCAVCGAGTWISYAGRSLCTAHAMAAAA